MATADVGNQRWAVHRPLDDLWCNQGIPSQPCDSPLPRGASIISCAPLFALPRRRVKFLFTAVSSMNTTRSGSIAMAGNRFLNQSIRCRLTVKRRQPAASFEHEAEPGQQVGDGGVVVHLHAFSGAQFPRLLISWVGRADPATNDLAGLSWIGFADLARRSHRHDGPRRCPWYPRPSRPAAWHPTAARRRDCSSG